MSINMNVQTEKARGTLIIEDATEANKSDVIRGFFNLMGSGKEHVQGITHSPDILIQGTTKVLEEKEAIIPEKNHNNAEILNIPRLEERAAPTKTEPLIKKPDLINSTRTLSPTIGEMLGVAPPQDVPEEEPEWYKTGIKYKEGVPHYKLRYWCKNPECKDRSNDYIKEDQETVCCRRCGEKLLVRQAADKHLKRDGWGNFFIADKLATDSWRD
ncbi:hypothetical protein [Paenibacillus sp. BR1-192]|uniref:hypothetical protein n=1 Tax=Paenibacillus sp. BR1-192 TaxID=3032287 RepID=UPI00240D1F15|nr:hypothetical protein [Paenibacillus sp. BR1-192]WFB60548.1 hypothetical protein P0X86_10230 [Paenibacillus sp. BR1-192]